MRTKNRNAGFTLLELMIVVSIIGILAGIAYPSYRENIMEGRRTDAKRALLTLQLAQEKYRSTCPQYATAIGAATNCATGTIVGNTNSPEGYYTLSIVAANAMTYTLRASRVATGQQNGDKCGDFEINQNGVKSIANNYSGYSVNKCW